MEKALLVAATVVAIAGPVAVGVLKAPRLRAAESPATDAGAPERSEVNSGRASGVASVKPNTSTNRRTTVTIQRDGRFIATNITLRELIRSAYGIQTDRSSAQILGGASWIDSDRFDIAANAESANPRTFPEEQIRSMLRTLLADRFRLTVHSEKRELPVYGLVMARSDGKTGPRLRRSDVDCAAAGRGHARHDRDQPGVFDAAGLLLGARLTPPTCGTHWSGPGRFTATGVTMTQLVTSLSLSPRLNRVVLDRTRLTGSFDLDLTFTPESLPSTLASLVEQLGLTPSIFTALQEQLGLELVPQTGPVDVLVIDHAEHPSGD